MPVTARLSKAFYERLGDDIANELVEWFNLVDATYRSDLREINEINFARFDAKVEQRFAQADAKFEQRFAQFETKTEQRFARFEANAEQRFLMIEGRVEHLDAKIDRVAVELRSEITACRTGVVADVTMEMTRRFDSQNRLLLLSWATVLAALVGIGLR